MSLVRLIHGAFGVGQFPWVQVRPSQLRIYAKIKQIVGAQPRPKPKSDMECFSSFATVCLFCSLRHLGVVELSDNGVEVGGWGETHLGVI